MPLFLLSRFEIVDGIDRILFILLKRGHFNKHIFPRINSDLNLIFVQLNSIEIEFFSLFSNNNLKKCTKIPSLKNEISKVSIAYSL